MRLLVVAAFLRTTAGLSQLPTARRCTRPIAQSVVHRTRPLIAQEGWVTGVDQGGQPYYFREATGEFQYEVPHAVQQNYGGRVLMSVKGLNGIHYWCNYALKNGDVQVLSRFALQNPKLTVSRVQAIVQIHDGTATLSSSGRGPTMWRPNGQNWIALYEGDQVPLNDGDEVSLDCNDPDSAVFVCQDEETLQQGGYGRQHDQPQLPHPWQQLVDQNGAFYFYNAQTGESSWDPPLQGGYGYPQQGGYDQQQYDQQQYGPPQLDQPYDQQFEDGYDQQQYSQAQLPFDERFNDQQFRDYR